MTRSGRTAPILRGHVDLRRIAEWTGSAAPAPVASADGRSHWTAPGCVLSWDPGAASHAASRDDICIVWGYVRAGPGPGFAPTVSAEEVRRLLAARGEEALAGLRGGYGLVYVDIARARVVMAIDRFSIETLCFAVDDDVVSFSDRADCVGSGTRELSLQAMFEYLHFHCIPAPATLFAGVRRLKLGHHLVARDGAIREEAHWQPVFAPPERASLAAMSEEFRALVRDAVAVERHGVTGCFLSGGTDSSTVAGMLARSRDNGPARTYSIGFDAQGYDEMEYARITARHFHTDHHEYYVTPEDVLNGITAVAAYCDQPFGNASIVPAFYCARMASADGVERLLAGDGGDELFGGNSRYAMQLFLELYQVLPHGLRTHIIEQPFVVDPHRRRLPLWKELTGYVRHARAPLPDRLEAFNFLTRIGEGNMLDRDFVAAIDHALPLAARRSRYFASSSRHAIDRMLHYDWKFTLADSDLPKVRMASALGGVGVGYPLLADELVDFALRLPPQWKVSRFRLRWFFKHALRDFLPPAVIRKKKHGFGLPFGVWTVQHASLRDLAGDSLAGLERRSILRKGFRDALLSQLLPAHPGFYGPPVWVLVMLEQWLAAHRTTYAMPAAPALAPATSLALARE